VTSYTGMRVKTRQAASSLVRQGPLPESEISQSWSVGSAPARIRDRGGQRGTRASVNPTILTPPSARTKSPWRCSRSFTEGQIDRRIRRGAGCWPALSARKMRRGLSASRLHAPHGVWTAEHGSLDRQKRDLDQALTSNLGRRIHLERRRKDPAPMLLVIIGATPEGKKELVGFTIACARSAPCGVLLMVDIKRRGL